MRYLIQNVQTGYFLSSAGREWTTWSSVESEALGFEHAQDARAFLGTQARNIAFDASEIVPASQRVISSAGLLEGLAHFPFAS